MNLDNIPSNFSIEEVLKFADLPAGLASLIEEQFEKVAKAEKELERIEGRVEHLQEQLYFRNEYIESVLKEAKQAKKCKELVSFIEFEFENSYIELWG